MSLGLKGTDRPDTESEISVSPGQIGGASRRTNPLPLPPPPPRGKKERKEERDEGGRSVAMEGGVAEKREASSSYTYWVREATRDAAPLPPPRKLSAEEMSSQLPNTLGSVWNQAGTWEERNLNAWASNRIKELLMSLGSLEFSNGRAEIDQVSKCVGDAFLVTVRNKKRVGYTYELSLKFKGEWLVQEERKKVKGHLDVPEFSFGELGDLQIEVRINEEKDLAAGDKAKISNDLRLFLPSIQERLLTFEQELKHR